MSLTKVTNNLIANASIDAQAIGLVHSSTAAAASNAQLLQNFVNPSTSSFKGKIIFTGDDVTYYFSSQQIRVCNGVTIDLDGNTLRFDFTASESNDVNKGFITVENDFEIYNGKIICRITDNPSYTNAGACLQLGLRDVDNYFGETVDGSLSYRKGNFYIHDLELDNDAINADAISSLAGVQNCIIENVTIKGNGTLRNGISYEWGWADRNATITSRETSHANNWYIRNVVIENCDQAINCRGGYNWQFNNIIVRNCDNGFFIGAGEASFRNPWSFDTLGSRNNMKFTNIVMQDIATIGMDLDGCNYGAIYLDPVITNSERIRLLDCSLENVKIGSANPSTSSWGIASTLRNLECKNVVVSGFDRGVFVTGDWWKIFMDFMTVTNSRREGIYLSKSDALFTNPNYVEIRNSNIYENGDGTSSDSSGIYYDVNVGSNVLIENNTFGVSGETSQYYSVVASVLSEDVMIRYNNTIATAGGVAYYRASSSSTRNNKLQDNVGDDSSTNMWELQNRFGYSSTSTNRTLSIEDEQSARIWGITASGATITIPPNSTASMSIGAEFHFLGQYASSTSSIAAGVAVTVNVLDGSSYTTGVSSVTIASGGFAHAVKTAQDTWLVYGNGITAVP